MWIILNEALPRLPMRWIFLGSSLPQKGATVLSVCYCPLKALKNFRLLSALLLDLFLRVPLMANSTHSLWALRDTLPIPCCHQHCDDKPWKALLFLVYFLHVMHSLVQVEIWTAALFLYLRSEQWGDRSGRWYIPKTSKRLFLSQSRSFTIPSPISATF